MEKRKCKEGPQGIGFELKVSVWTHVRQTDSPPLLPPSPHTAIATKRAQKPRHARSNEQLSAWVLVSKFYIPVKEFTELFGCVRSKEMLKAQ